MKKLKMILGFLISIISVIIWLQYMFAFADMPQVVEDISMNEVRYIYITNCILTVLLIFYNIILYKSRSRNNIFVLSISALCSFLWKLSFPHNLPNSDLGLINMERTLYAVCVLVNLMCVISQTVYFVLYLIKYKKHTEE